MSAMHKMVVKAAANPEKTLKGVTAVVSAVTPVVVKTAVAAAPVASAVAAAAAPIAIAGAAGYGVYRFVKWLID